jgi:Tfp pilus assembly protein PilN
VSQVNLLPPDILAAQRQRRMAGVVALAGVGVIGLILVFYVLQWGKVSAIRDDIDTQERTNAGLEAQIAQLQQFDELRAKAQSKEDLLNEVFANEVSFSGLLMDVSRVIPPTSALTSLSASRDEPTPATGGSTLLLGRIDVSGVALDYDAVHSWLTRLERVRGWVNPWVTSIADPATGPITYTSGVDLTEGAVTTRGRRAGGVTGAG